jgi:hypothetical protein
VINFSSPQHNSLHNKGGWSKFRSKPTRSPVALRDDSRGERLKFVAHDNDAPREIAKARKYETTKKVEVAKYAGNLA